MPSHEQSPAEATALAPAARFDAYASNSVSEAEQAPEQVPEAGISAPMVAALEGAWAAIRARHRELPAVFVVLGGGSDGRPGTLKLGHFAALRWTSTPRGSEPGDAAPAPLGEVFVGGEGLALGPVDVLGTLLHEAAHALADVRGVKDTSRQGRYHNAKFKALAEELGIEVTKDPAIGWSPTTVTEATRVAYAEIIEGLGHALRMYRAIEGVGFGPVGPGGATGDEDDDQDGDQSEPEDGKRKSPPSCVCCCGRRIRVAPSVLELGPIVCGVCGEAFTPDTGDRAAAADDPDPEPEPDDEPDGELDDGVGQVVTLPRPSDDQRRSA